MCVCVCFVCGFATSRKDKYNGANLNGDNWKRKSQRVAPLTCPHKQVLENTIGIEKQVHLENIGALMRIVQEEAVQRSSI